MSLVERVPFLGSKIRVAKGGVASLVTKSIDDQYDKAKKNFLVLGLGMRQATPAPQLVKKCKSFFKDNKKESVWPLEVCSRLDIVFARLDNNEFFPEDGDWFVGDFQVFLEERKRALKFGFMAKVLR